MNKFDELIIPYYSPLSAKGGNRRLRRNRTKKNIKNKNKKTRKVMKKY